MVKKKDYTSAILMGTIWILICLAIASGGAALVYILTSSNTIATFIFGMIMFIMGIYKGRDFFKVEMKTVTKDDPKTDWMSALGDIQILLLAGVYINAINSLNDGFSWTGLAALLMGLIFVVVIVYMKNTRFGK